MVNTTSSLASSAESAAGDADGQGQQHGRRLGLLHDPVGGQLEEPGRDELRRDDHQREEQDEGRDIDTGAELVEGDGRAGQQHDDAQEGDAGTVDLQMRQPSGGHADIGADENEDDDEGVHGSARTGRIIGGFVAERAWDFGCLVLYSDECRNPPPRPAPPSFRLRRRPLISAASTTRSAAPSRRWTGRFWCWPGPGPARHGC